MIYILIEPFEYSHTEIVGVYGTYEEASQEALRRLYLKERLGAWESLEFCVEEWEFGGKSSLAIHQFERRRGEDRYEAGTFESNGYTLLRKWDNGERAWYKRHQQGGTSDGQGQ